MVLAGELIGACSARVTRRLERYGPSALAAAPRPGAAALGVPLAIAPLRLSSAGRVPLAPALDHPVDLPGAFQLYHPLASGETLGELARRYGVSLESLVWANGLDQGDALLVGQLLRIPRVSGLPHIVARGETIATIAAQFGVVQEAIVSFGPNGLYDDLQLRAGAELFIPGGARPMAEGWLQSVGGAEGLALRGPEPAGIVREVQTNMRTGPSTEHPRVAQLAAGRQVALRARYQDWLEVELGPSRGWVRRDMLDVPEVWVAALPETTDFPPPPPHWVWPARGVISSGFGRRWGSFHNGLDIANRAWAPIVAARAGTVTEAGWCSGYGYCVRLRHDGGLETIYGHLIDRPVVSAGDEVAAGEVVGYMGSTYDRAGGGYSTGVHLHFTVYLNGKAVDPLRFLP